MCSSKAVGLLLHRPARYNRQDTLHRLCSSLLGRSYHPVALIHRGPIPRLYYRWSHLHLPCRYLIVSLAFRVICCHVLVLPTVTSGHRWVYPGMGYRGLHLQHVLTWTPKVAKAVTETENSVPAWLSLAPIILARDLACWRYTGPRSYGFHEDTVTANSAKALAFNAVTFCGFTVLLIHSEG